MRKNRILKLLVWALYAVTVGGCFLTVVTLAVAGRGYRGNIALAVAGVLFVAVGLSFFALRGILRVGRRAEREKKKNVAVVAEILALLLCLIGMLAVRIPAMPRVMPNAWSAAAEVSAGQALPLTGHGGADVFLWLLHGVFFVFGNKLIAAVVLQVVLQVVAAFFIYAAVRRLSGSVAALVALVFYAFSPYLFRELMVLSPLALFLALGGMTVWLVAGIWSRWNRKRESRGAAPALFLYLAAGLLAGLCCWMDTAGIVMVVFLLWAILLYRDQGSEESGSKPQGFWNNRAFISIFCLLIGVLGYFGLHALAGYMTGRGFWRVVALSANRFVPGSFRIPADIYGRGPVLDVLAIVCLLVMGIFSFFRGHMQRSGGVWLTAAVVLLGLQCFGIAGREPVNSFALLYLFCAAAGGSALGVMFQGNADSAPKTSETLPEKPPKQDEEPVPEKKPSIEAPVLEEKLGTEAPAPESEPRETEEVHYIENPLPLPKKSDKKFMDFDHEVPDDDDFDIL